MSTPNVFFLAIDSLRADAVFGDHIATPNFDSVAGRGAAFTQCVSTTTSTTPSFSSILTGCYPPKHGVRGLQGYQLSPALTTWAEAFGAAGYATHAEVTGPLLPATGVLRGFDEANHRPGYKVAFMDWRDDIVAKMSSYTEPYFMLLHIWEVHRPYRMPPDFTKRWDKAGYEGAVATVDDWLKPVFEAAGDNTIVVITGDHGEDYPETPLQQKLIRVARRSRRSLKLEKWWPYLDQRFSSLAVGHGFALHEHLVRVPLIIAGPGVNRARVDEQVRHVDLFPTMADLCGVESPKGLDGRSLRPLIEGGSLPEEPAYMEAVGVKLEGKRIEGARTDDWKLLRVRGGRPSLYRLNGAGGGGAGADEKHNHYSRHPEVARKLESFIDEVTTHEAVAGSGMTADEEATVEQHLRDLGYL
ncbi:MAG: sulfatase family protein [Actinomycetota bacterium]